MAIRKPGAYAPLSAHYADDEAIMQAGEAAELLYLRMLAYAARTPLTEGWISEAVMVSRLGFREDVRETVREDVRELALSRRIERLREAGLITRDGTGYQIASWLRWNKSAAEMGKERARDRKRKASDLHVSGTGAGNSAGTSAGVPNKVPPPIPLANTEAEANTETLPAQAPPTTTDVAIHTDDPQTTQALIGEWVDHCQQPPPGRVKGQVAKEIKTMLDEGIDYERVRAGLADWNTRDLHPSVLPSIVHGIGNRQNGSRRQAATDDMFERAMQRARALDAAE